MKKIIKNTRGLTLIELLATIGLISIVLLSLSTAYTFLFRQAIRNAKFQNMYLQVNYALENIRLHCLSAIQIDSDYMLTAGVSNSKDAFKFQGESNIYQITPNDLTDNVWYLYSIKNGNLVLSTFSLAKPTETMQEEILIDSQFSPTIEFQYVWETSGERMEPNFFAVNITTHNSDNSLDITKTEGIRFWFVDIVQ